MAADMFRIYEQYSKDIKFSELQNPEESWELLDVIGEGTYGEVYSAKNKDTGTRWPNMWSAWLGSQISWTSQIIHNFSNTKSNFMR